MQDFWTTSLIVGFLIISGFGLYFYRYLYNKRKITTEGTLSNEGTGGPDFKSINDNLGFAVLSKEGRIIWFNKVFSYLIGRQIKNNTDIKEYLPGFTPGKEYDGQEFYRLGKKVFYLRQSSLANKDRYLLSCEDVSAIMGGQAKPQDLQPVISFLQLDNLEEVLKQIPDGNKPQLIGTVSHLINEWVGNLEGYLRPLDEGRYIIFLTQWGFNQAEKNRFALLDRIREIDTQTLLPFTMSMGIGVNEDSPGELGRLAQAALELALERGGDQVVVKSPGNVKFYGGRSKSIEKRTKVKARAVASALRELITESRQVLIMGHEMADFDSLGAALGLAKAVVNLGKKAFVIIDEVNSETEKLFSALDKEAIGAQFVKAGEAERKATDNSLLIIVDTHKPSLLPVPALVRKGLNIAVIDHHRRGEEFIFEPKLVYLETYASSTSELVTEVLQYLGDEVEIGRLEATALLAGIAVDTKNFMTQTGVRTFEAASYLRSKGADPGIVQTLLRDDITTVIKKADVIRGAKILYGKVALGKSSEKSHDAIIMAAKTADTMMNIAGVKASFVMWPQEGSVAISARSNGEINVQRIMESMGGGGHLNIAAAQVQGSLEVVESRLLDILEEELHPKEA